MKLTPLLDNQESSPRYPTRYGWRKSGWVRRALATAGATAMIWAGGCAACDSSDAPARPPGEPPAVTRTGGTPVPTTPEPVDANPPEGEAQPAANKPPESDGGPLPLPRTEGVTTPAVPPGASAAVNPSPRPMPPRRPVTLNPEPPERYSGDRMAPSYPLGE
jgi:hypothetical protein